ncbi:hypothetical protein BVI434_280013 [Burkholderia vietnamiensis]|nr:hypothetical protein BVI434_280013 [Burkholderia vietnamiensis]
MVDNERREYPASPGAANAFDEGSDVQSPNHRLTLSAREALRPISDLPIQSEVGRIKRINRRQV